MDNNNFKIQNKANEFTSALWNIIKASAAFEPNLALAMGAVDIGVSYIRDKNSQQIIKEAFSKIEDLGVSVDELKNNHELIQSIYYTSKIAVVADQEKQKYLKNIIMNSVNKTGIDLDKQLHFFEILNGISNTKIELLLFLDDPKIDTSSIFSNSLKNFMVKKIPALKGHDDYLNSILSDLENKGLIQENIKDLMSTTLTADGLNNSRTTELGKEFLKFISVD